jgi:hypothetical protein
MRRALSQVLLTSSCGGVEGHALRIGTMLTGKA